jgi:hypothetical protein
MRYEKHTRQPTEQRRSHTQTATLFVPFGAEQRLLSLCARCGAQVLEVRALVEPFRGFSVDIVSLEHSGSELLVGWIDTAKVLEGART